MVMNLLRKTFLSILLAVPMTAFIAAPVMAQEATASGEVRRVDQEVGRITIKHSAIADLDLPAMTLVYHAQATLLQGIKPGDKIKFTAKRENDRYVVTKISK